MGSRVTLPDPGERVILRHRVRCGRPPEAGGDYTTWTEWQVVGSKGRVLARFDFEHAALAWARKNGALVTEGRS